jgi:Ca2+/H+ antiporter, TMEM165/GDT1 family
LPPHPKVGTFLDDWFIVDKASLNPMLPPDPIAASLSTFTLIALAEIGDKSQLVCMTLAARHRHWPVLLGAVTAFLLLNALAVLFGAGIAAWVPERVTAAIVAVLFAGFGIHALRQHGDAEEAEAVAEGTGHGIFFTTLLLILVAEFGDKTQIAVAGLAGSLPPWPVWLGATAALALVSGLGVWAGRTLLQRLPLHWLHRLGGGIFLLFALLAAWRALGLAA